MNDNYAEVARRGYEAAMRGDYDAIAELLHPEVQWHGGDPSAKGACRNREEALAFMHDAWRRRGRPGKLIDVVGAGDKVVVIMQPAGAEAPRRLD